MKALKYISVILTMVIFHELRSQCVKQVNTTSTDWRVTGSSNTWDWTQKGSVYPVYLSNNSNSPSAYIALPYFHVNSSSGTGTPDGYQNVANYLFRGPDAKDQDINPEDGWELLLKDFGTPNSVPGNNTGVGRATPFFILYNRLNGKMKIYAALFGSRAQQAAFIRIGFSDDKLNANKKGALSEVSRALYSSAEPIQKTVIEFKPLLEFKQMNQIIQYPTFSTSDYQWLLAELTTSYDPCTCENPTGFSNGKSIQELQVVATSSADINATIDGAATQQTVASNNSVAQSSDGFMSFFEPAVEAGQKGYDKWSKIKGTAENVLEFGNETLAKELVRAWLNKDNLGYNSDNPALNKMSRQALKTFISSPDSFKNMLGVPKPGDVKFGKILNAAKGVASNLPYVGAALGVLDYFVNGGQEVANAQPNVGPVTFDVQLKLRGTITEANDISTVNFFTPGSPNQLSNSSYLSPIYNNVLGVFNVLDLPDLEYAELTPHIANFTQQQMIDINALSSNSCQRSFDKNEDNYDGAGEIKLREYRPRSNVKYVLNPSSNLEVISIDGAIVLEYQNDQKIFLKRPDEINNAIAFPYHDLMSVSHEFLDTGICYMVLDTAGKSEYRNMDPDSFQLLLLLNRIPKKRYCDTLYSGLDRRVTSIINSQGLELEYASANYPYQDSTKIRFRTKYMPITCFTETNFMLLGSNNFGKAYVKLYIKLKRKDKPGSEPVTILMTYDYTEKLKTAQKNSNISGTYNAVLAAKDVVNGTQFGWKCSGSGVLDGGFPIVKFKDWMYGSNVTLNTIPFGSQWYTPQSATYSGQQFYTVKGSLIIPTNSVIPENSIIKAVGKIIVMPNVTIGSGSEIISCTKIEIKPTNAFSPKVTFKIQPINEVLYNCSDFDFAALHNDSQEISHYCGLLKYKDKAFATPAPLSKDTFSTKIEFGLQIKPNPTSGDLKVSWTYDESIPKIISVMDLLGRELYRSGILTGDEQFHNLFLTQIPDGVYLVSFKAGNYVSTNKIIVTR
ncbi:MAG: T9SS type A sorting domain-containing protein [Bacteroidetes bacterium]|nr:T9SS type A sorting domain-containing protein [Bacteroidota bacterium]